MINTTKKLQTDPFKYANEKIKHYDNLWLKYRIIYVCLSIFIAVLAIAAAVLTAYIIYFSKKESTNGHVAAKPSWYFYTETAAAAVIAMLSSLLNFFYVKTHYMEAGKRKHKLHTEIILFQNNIGQYRETNKNRVFEFYVEISKICGAYVKNNKIHKLKGDKK